MTLTSPPNIDLESFLTAYPQVYQREGNFITVRPPDRVDGDELDPVPYTDETLPNAGQVPIWLAKQRHLFMIAGTRGGKSHIGPLWLDRHIKRVTKRFPRTVSEFGIAAPTLMDIMSIGIGLGRMARFYRETKGWDEDLILNKRTLTIDLQPVGIPAIIYTASENRMHRFQGKNIHAMWIDEGGAFKKEDSYIEAVSRTTKDSQVLMTTTPYMEGMWLKDRVEVAKLGDPDDDILVVRYPSIVNPYFPYELWARQERDLPPPYFNMFYRAQFELPIGMVYPDVTYCEPFTIPHNWERMLIVDPSQGGPAPFAALWIAIDPNPPNTWYAYREYYTACHPLFSNWKKEHAEVRRPGDLMDEIREASCYERWIPAERNEYGNTEFEGYFEPIDEYERIGRIFYDPASPWIGDWLEENFPDSLVFKPDKTKNSGLADTATMLRRGEDGGLVIFNNLPKWKWERDRYVYKADLRGITSGEPVKNDDHLMDCTRYGVRQCPEAKLLANFSHA